MARSEQTDSFLPLAATEYAVLLALADGEKHGYAILREVLRHTGRAVAQGRFDRRNQRGLSQHCDKVAPGNPLSDQRLRFLIGTNNALGAVDGQRRCRDRVKKTLDQRGHRAHLFLGLTRRGDSFGEDRAQRIGVFKTDRDPEKTF